MWKKIGQVIVIIALLICLGTPSIVLASEGDSEKAIDEKYGAPIVVLGGSLTDAQKDETKKLLKVNDGDDITEITVTGEDAEKYINGDPNSRMFSSAKITRLDKGQGIRVVQITPENITEVTNEMYANALITAGIEDAQIEVASPVKVTGHSALTGIFKAYEVSGEELDTARLEVANEELDVATSLAEDAGISQEQVSELLTEIKQAIAEQNPATREEVEKIVEDQLKELNITIPDKYKQMLIDLFDKIRNLDIDFGEMKNQLENLASDIQDKLEEAGIDKGFFQGILDFIGNILREIGNFFGNLFGSK
ncbi:DUF1002 domain-containing protein [Caldibacillus lycopersici]|uniref:DUF1002 domain-containing protein n=1 Tax=Perspicuibacillus lycopersici TaxID=1325689 RepID=A0AAE3LPL6_9BACI|nr:DUF1002 domain-containing protein [Perspicuibacillus lycopersici]MCU9615087.1 DUF1002 domain-containing protein [Perspicuibacillus lycopersici]